MVPAPVIYLVASPAPPPTCTQRNYIFIYNDGLGSPLAAALGSPLAAALGNAPGLELSTAYH